ncbi:hypothetical protein I4Q36_09060 [Tuanshanicoccus lijuaniae]|uniref:hypothetical protein n=1 Tax=Aerococcaceae bacterium zg-1292 TaxID=2774330 RepID=UPI0019363A90|nr:hypothetical protein [Aerococcaceae bacterium zg-1292]MBF6626615.1 hypothetical protein [Aerococcaceae bacterium zg-BR9]MBF6978981.1 hypothetical protein [Aerococcaceae bacterium zg-BR22]MBS4455414.1 hypothetical protein [Aerococcaceae bacterium zg-A91]MBS4457374.1 hypothetical protein [Aerococcaceae bacterium zg-BR33]
METVRKNITMPINTYETINNYAKKNGVTFSEFLRESALKIINQKEELSLLEYLQSNCEFMVKEEQEEIEALNIDFDDFSGKEMSLDELLQD